MPLVLLVFRSLLFRVIRDSLFVFVVDFDSKEFLDALRRPHLDGIPGHTLANVNADFAADTFVKPDLHVRNDNVHTIRSIPRHVHGQWWR